MKKNILRMCSTTKLHKIMQLFFKCSFKIQCFIFYGVFSSSMALHSYYLICKRKILILQKILHWSRFFWSKPAILIFFIGFIPKTRFSLSSWLKYIFHLSLNSHFWVLKCAVGLRKTKKHFKWISFNFFVSQKFHEIVLYKTSIFNFFFCFL